MWLIVVTVGVTRVDLVLPPDDTRIPGPPTSLHPPGAVHWDQASGVPGSSHLKLSLGETVRLSTGGRKLPSD